MQRIKIMATGVLAAGALLAGTAGAAHASGGHGGPVRPAPGKPGKHVVVCIDLGHHHGGGVIVVPGPGKPGPKPGKPVPRPGRPETVVREAAAKAVPLPVSYAPARGKKTTVRVERGKVFVNGRFVPGPRPGRVLCFVLPGPVGVPGGPIEVGTSVGGGKAEQGRVVVRRG
ncbi:hypothetical protein RKE29_07805 [Streptomyces sp. B1866]|uniref:hypothetical protein n=1 Tax=Streptomyces sp. B1866 TaxID=3075431 RepID=UPI00288E000A|nr:hypothetical protein [Streptomyces sp. B1866]MDT3396546.1 hypothetical protein [Streptomyces sp. B1866]